MAQGFMPREEEMRQIELFAENIIPAFRRGRHSRFYFPLGMVSGIEDFCRRAVALTDSFRETAKTAKWRS
jgi:hypothetical protein